MMFRAVSRRINIFRALLLTSGKERDPDSDAEKKIKILSILAAKTLKLPTASAFSSDSEKNEHIQRLADKIRELTVDELDELLISVRKIVIPEQSVKKLEKGEQKVPGIVACFAMTMAAAKEGEVNSDSATSRRVLGPDEISALKWYDIYKLSRTKRIQLGNQLKPSLRDCGLRKQDWCKNGLR
ncbi:hypothetical protein V6N11_004888 [Hibiscus sabdariffa]|uniref:Uncharacterized protein n=1 Tax=Hibiscus sabdariffa TaxID=183260 RepID=A0ABR2SHF0_9ROSI